MGECGELTGVSVYFEPKIDCHCHLLDPARFPYDPQTRYAPTGQEIATLAQMLTVHDAFNVRHALLVQPNSGYGFDNSCVLDALARHPDRFRAIAVVPLDTSLEQLAALKSRGVLGVAFNVTFHGMAYYEQSGPLLEKLAQLDMFVDIQFEHEQFLALMPILARHNVRVLVDHCGRPTTAWGVAHPAFQALLDLGRTGRAVVKLSGYIKFAETVHPYPDVVPFVNALLDAYGADNCIWSSDWPFLKAPERVDFAPLVQLAGDLFADPSLRRQLFWDNAARLFGF